MKEWLFYLKEAYRLADLIVNVIAAFILAYIGDGLHKLNWCKWIRAICAKGLVRFTEHAFYICKDWDLRGIINMSYRKQTEINSLLDEMHSCLANGDY